MPELPDVQVFREYVDATSLHQSVTRTSVEDADVLVDTTAALLARRLKGSRFEGTRRHGKHLFLDIAGNGWLRLHFGMTGFLRYYKRPGHASDHIRLRIDFENGYHLAYDCQRKFGEVEVVEDVRRFIDERDLGPDPLEPGFDLDRFVDLVGDRRGSVKAALMNQSVMAGIGNIYSDEILFQAGVRPDAEVRRLDRGALKDIYLAMHRVLKKAIECRVDPERWPDWFLLPDRTEGARCPRCGGRVEKAKIAGRTSYYCNRHQRK